MGLFKGGLRAGAVEAFAFAARRQGRRSMPRSAWEHTLSLELGWMSPAQARAYVQRAVAAGVLLEEPDGLRVAVDPKEVEVPRGFRPDLEAPLGVPRQDPFLELVDRVAATRGVKRAAVLEEVAVRQERMGGLLDALTAARWVASEHRHDEGRHEVDAAHAQ